MKVLVTDALNRIPFDVHNILERNHRDLGVLLLGSPDRLYRTRARLVYGRRIESLRKDSYAHFEEDLNRIVQAHAGEELVYVPLEEDTTRVFYRYIESNSPANLRYNLPEHSRFELAADKKALSGFCAANGIPAPAEFSSGDVQALRSSFVPLIAKPRQGSGAVGIFRIDRPEQLEALGRLYDSHLFQERLSVEHGVRGAFYLFDRGRMVSCYAHRRILTYPRQGGVTTYSRIDNDP